MRKSILIYGILLILMFNYLFALNVACVTYDIGVEKNAAYIWSVDTYDEDTYMSYFNEKPDYEEGVQKKVKIVEINERKNDWTITYDLWDYTKDTDKFNEEPDDQKTKKIYKDPGDLAENILTIDDIADMWLVLVPVSNYLEEFRDKFENEYFNIYVEESTLEAKYAFSHIEYEVKMTYTLDGMVEKIEYIKSDETVFVEINLQREEVIDYQVLIPIILVVCLISIIIIIVWKKKLKQ